MGVQFGLYFEDEARPRMEALEVNEAQNRFSIRVDREATAVVLDPEAWVLMEAEFEKRE